MRRIPLARSGAVWETIMMMNSKDQKIWNILKSASHNNKKYYSLLEDAQKPIHYFENWQIKENKSNILAFLYKLYHWVTK